MEGCSTNLNSINISQKIREKKERRNPRYNHATRVFLKAKHFCNFAMMVICASDPASTSDIFFERWVIVFARHLGDLGQVLAHMVSAGSKAIS